MPIIKSSPVTKIQVKKRPSGSISAPLYILLSKNTFFLYYRLKKNPYSIYVATSLDGLNFSKLEKIAHISIGKYTKVDVSKCSDFSVSEQDGYLNLTYVWSGKKKTVEKAYTKNLFTWTYEGGITSLKNNGTIVPNLFYKKQQIMYVKDDGLYLALSKDLASWSIVRRNLLGSDKKIFSIGCALPTDHGILLAYYVKNKNKLRAYVVLFDAQEPSKVLWQTSTPIWEQPAEWKNVSPIGVILFNNRLIAYYHIPGQGTFASVLALYKNSDGHTSKDISLKLKRVAHNPIIKPKATNSWEAFCTFNPAAVFDNGKVHLLYRAQGYDYISVIGYATSPDGSHIDYQSNKPIYIPSESFEFVGPKKPKDITHIYMSCGYGGCEDPRITKIDGRFYLTYVAFDGINPPRVALTSIKESDFRNKLWFWDKPVLISPPGTVDKSAVIFPEKIKGKYVIMHRIYPNILIDFVDNLEFDGTHWLKGQYKIAPRPHMWDSKKIGAGAPPIKTKYGWLLIYQSVGEQDSGKYKVGAMLLDLKDPTKVLYRSKSPILEPDAEYENNGFKAGVVYPCGAVIINGTLYVYYGSADSYVCVATANLESFLKELMHSQIAKLVSPIERKVL